MCDFKTSSHDKKQSGAQVEHSDCSNHGGSGVGGVYQTLKEMDFARGPWNAAASGDEDTICKYLNKGGDVNLNDSSGYTPLHYSARNGHEQISLLLLQHGASVNACTKAGKSTALHRAAATNSTSVVDLLLRFGADPCAQDADGKTPLHKAVEAQNSDVCRLLIEKDPNCKDIKDNKGKAAQDYIT